MRRRLDHDIGPRREINSFRFRELENDLPDVSCDVASRYDFARPLADVEDRGRDGNLHIVANSDGAGEAYAVSLLVRTDVNCFRWQREPAA